MKMLSVSHKPIKTTHFFQEHGHSPHLCRSGCNWWSRLRGSHPRSNDVTIRFSPISRDRMEIEARTNGAKRLGSSSRFGGCAKWPTSQTCSLPWGVLSLNVNSGKAWWSTLLLSIAPDCPCYNALYDRRFLWWNDLSPMKITKNPLGSWIQGSAGSAGSWAFLSKFWFGKVQKWIRRERRI